MPTAAPRIIRPHKGPQEMFLATPADIAWFGGAAGPGKSFALLLDPTRHIRRVEGFGSVMFRRNVTQVLSEGGLWSTSNQIYPHIGGEPRESKTDWSFGPHGNKIKFAHLEYDKDVLSWQGSQIPMIGFDELTHFTEKQFWYMLSRNRSMCGVKPYIRATTNPDPHSWVRSFISWWIGDPKCAECAAGKCRRHEHGYAIPERAGVIRWFMRVNDEIIWAKTPDELTARYPELIPKSFTFIPGTLNDNPTLVKKDPGYRANLMSLSRVDRDRLLHGNWNTVEAAGELFRASWFALLDHTPADVTRWVRYWDRAATEPSASNPDPDYTVGVLMGLRADRSVVIADVVRDRTTPGGVEKLIQRVTLQDARTYDGVVSWQQTDPGQAGKVERHHLSRALSGFDVRFDPVPRAAKLQRAKPLSAQAEAGNVALIRGSWVDAFLNEAEQFPQGNHDDQVDAAAGAFQRLRQKVVDAVDVWQ